MLIVAGWLQVEPARRGEYLRLAAAATAAARAAEGCLAFVQAPDPIEADRIVVYERWASEARLLAFRDQEPDGTGAVGLPPLLGADVRRYEIHAEGPP